MEFILFIGFIILQRITELVISKKNEIWLRAQGAIEYGQGHYILIVILHTLFIVSLITEYLYSGSLHTDILFLVIYLLLVAVKVWVISSLCRYWNTKIFRVPNAPLIKTGPYKLVKHPNYIIVVCEIGIIPLVFHLYYTAIIFSVLNAVMLYIRIREENKVLV